MPYQRIKYYQAGSFAAGNRLLDPDQRTVQAESGRSNAITCGHRACQGCGEALGARYALDAAQPPRSATTGSPAHSTSTPWLSGTADAPAIEPAPAEFERLKPVVLRRRSANDPPRARGRAAPVDLRGGRRRARRLLRAVRGPPVPACGSCFACDNCYGVCPDNAVIKLEPTGAYAYAIDLDYCKGCGLCTEECPCGAIEMVPVTI